LITVDLIVPKVYERDDFFVKKSNLPNFLQDKIVKILKNGNNIYYQIMEKEYSSKFSFIELILKNKEFYKQDTFLICEKVSDGFNVFIGNTKTLVTDGIFKPYFKKIRNDEIRGEKELFEKISFLLDFYGNFTFYTNDEYLKKQLKEKYSDCEFKNEKEIRTLFSGIKPIEDIKYKIFVLIKNSLMPFLIIIIFYLGANHLEYKKNEENKNKIEKIANRLKAINEGNKSEIGLFELQEKAKVIKELKSVRGKCYDN